MEDVGLLLGGQLEGRRHPLERVVQRPVAARLLIGREVGLKQTCSQQNDGWSEGRKGRGGDKVQRNLARDAHLEAPKHSIAWR